MTISLIATYIPIEQVRTLMMEAPIVGQRHSRRWNTGKAGCGCMVGGVVEL